MCVFCSTNCLQEIVILGHPRGLGRSDLFMLEIKSVKGKSARLGSVQEYLVWTTGAFHIVLFKT